ncbi:MAG TPA: ABC transporter permease [Micromonosporaceae bacterium]|nr:ABC transporter permease [Micromonosporaceae bacterium]
MSEGHDAQPEYLASSPDKEPAERTEVAEEAATQARLDARNRAQATDQAAGTEPAAAQPSTFAARFLRALWSANTVTVTVLAIALAMVLGAILIIVSDANVRRTYSYFFTRPSDALTASWNKVADAYANLFKGAIVDPEALAGAFNGTVRWERVFYPISETLSYTAPLAFTGLAFAVAFRGGLFNIGVQGQAIMGAIAAGLVGFLLPLPVGVHLLVALLAAALAGGLYGYVPGILKARTGAHEVITTIMLNYVALFFLSWLIVQEGIQAAGRTDAISEAVHPSAELPRLLAPVGQSLRVHLGIVLAVLVVWGVAWLLGRSTFGFELRAVGLNPEASRTAGMNVARTYAMVMAVAGALAGLGGATILLGTAFALTGAVVGSAGFDGLLVGLLGRAKPWGVLLAALLFGALRAGGNQLQVGSGISLELVSVLQALIVVFVAAPALVAAIFRLRPAQAGGLETGMAKGW